MVAEAIFLVSRVVVGGMFLVALVSKVRDLPSFRSALRGFRVVPRRLERPVTFAVLGAEAATVLLMVDQTSAPIGLAVAAVLLVAFAVGMVRVLARGERVPCGCFGRSAAPISRAHVWRNGLLAATGVAGLVAGLTSGAGPLDGPTQLVLSLFAVAVVAVLLLSDQLLAVPEPPRRPEPRHHRPPVDSPSTGTTRKR
ncbi:MAG: hypothetical protein LH603_19735 [Pseudonocardia sp.]|nr:hypothetical protein [Pseudonocardia sp.]